MTKSQVKISEAGVKKLTEIFTDLNLLVPKTLPEWPLEYAREIAEFLIDPEGMWLIDPVTMRSRLLDLVEDLGVYGPVEEMR